jgi:hypothetical protein
LRPTIGASMSSSARRFCSEMTPVSGVRIGRIMRAAVSVSRSFTAKMTISTLPDGRGVVGRLDAGQMQGLVGLERDAVLRMAARWAPRATNVTRRHPAAAARQNSRRCRPNP